jgi:hypothetical protein
MSMGKNVQVIIDFLYKSNDSSELIRYIADIFQDYSISKYKKKEEDNNLVKILVEVSSNNDLQKIEMDIKENISDKINPRAIPRKIKYESSNRWILFNSDKNRYTVQVKDRFISIPDNINVIDNLEEIPENNKFSEDGRPFVRIEKEDDGFGNSTWKTYIQLKPYNSEELIEYQGVEKEKAVINAIEASKEEDLPLLLR